MIYFAPFSLESIFQVLVPDSIKCMIGILKTISASPSHLDPERNDWERGQPEPNPQILLQQRCSWRGELAGTEVPEEYGPSWLRLSRGTTPSREGGSKSAVTTPSDVQHPEEKLTEYRQFSNLTLFSDLRKSAPTVLLYWSLTTLPPYLRADRRAGKPRGVVLLRLWRLEHFAWTFSSFIYWNKVSIFSPAYLVSAPEITSFLST